MIIENQNTEFKAIWKDEYCTRAGLPAPDFDYTGGLTIIFKKVNKTFEELRSIEYDKDTINDTINQLSDIEFKILRDKYGINTGYLRDKYGINSLKILSLIDKDDSITIPVMSKKLNVSLSQLKN